MITLWSSIRRGTRNGQRYGLWTLLYALCVAGAALATLGAVFGLTTNFGLAAGLGILAIYLCHLAGLCERQRLYFECILLARGFADKDDFVTIFPRGGCPLMKKPNE